MLSERIARVMNPLPPLRARKDPWLALVLGFLLSGAVLDIYLRFWIDLIVPSVIWVVLILTPRRGMFLDRCGHRKALGIAQGCQLQ